MSLRSFVIEDSIDSPLARAIEVTVELESGERRWCYFATPQSLTRFGDWVRGTQLRIHHGAPHLIVLSSVTTETIESALKHIDAEGGLHGATRATGSPPMSCSLEVLNEITGPDFRIASHDGWTLTIHAAVTDYPDSWHAKIVFQGVSYIDCPTEFSHAKFAKATPDEHRRIATKVPVDDEDHVVTITAETMAGMEVNAFYIVYESVSVIQKSSQSGQGHPRG